MKVDQNRKSVPPICVEELAEAENTIVKVLQKRHFPEEYDCLTESEVQDDTRNVKATNMKSSSNLRKLSPILLDQVIRVGGRLDRASINPDAKHPVILPYKSHVTDLIIKYYHELSGHSGCEYVLSSLRKKFWVIKGNSAVRCNLLQCHACRRSHGARGKQVMADLPADRVRANQPPFSSVGIDCFGPFLIKRGRSDVKRHSVIFTCLSVRAIHIELVHSLA